MLEESTTTALSISMPDRDNDSISSQARSTSNTKLLSPPFSSEKAVVKEPPLLPATIHAHHGRSMLLISPSVSNSSISPITMYIRNELDVSRLNSVHRHLWMAGLPRPARSLHRQELNGRQIVLTEQADLHLCWYKTRIFIKRTCLIALLSYSYRFHLSQKLESNELTLEL